MSISPLLPFTSSATPCDLPPLLHLCFSIPSIAALFGASELEFTSENAYPSSTSASTTEMCKALANARIGKRMQLFSHLRRIVSQFIWQLKADSVICLTYWPPCTQSAPIGCHQSAHSARNRVRSNRLMQPIGKSAGDGNLGHDSC